MDAMCGGAGGDPREHRRALGDIARGFLRGKVLCAGVRIGVFDALSNEMTAVELATALDVEPTALRRLLRGLASIGVVEERASGNYALTPFGRPLRRDAPDSVWASMVFWADLIADAWTYLDECVRVGDHAGVAQALERNAAKSRWALEENPQAIFHAVFAEPTAADNAVYAAALDCSGCQVVADLGGGGGGLLAAVLGEHPHLRGMLVDRPEAIQQATGRFETGALAGRCQLIAADLIDAVPAGADRYLLRSVLHGYDDDQARKILANCRAVLEEDARLLIIEAVLPDLIAGPDPDLEGMFLSDLNMLVVTGGRERSRTDWEQLLASQSLTMRRVIPVTGAPQHSIIEATPEL